jgi:hypothetical protein
MNINKKTVIRTFQKNKKYTKFKKNLSLDCLLKNIKLTQSDVRYFPLKWGFKGR